MANGIKIGNLDVSSFKVGSADCRVYLGDTCVYSGDTPTPHDYSQDYLTFRALEDGTFSFSGSGAISANTLEYSVDSGATWSTLQNSGTTPTVTSGNTILWKASGLTIGSSNGIGKFSSTKHFKAEGNIMSLHFGDDFSGQTSLSGINYAFSKLFADCLAITSAENLILPATTLERACYGYMFNNCRNLTTAPVLSATTLATQCYTYMFQDCTSLTTAPELPATTLAAQCYRSMFQACISLTTAPELPATTLADSCYRSMFSSCRNLTTAPELPATTLATQCYNGMFQGCKSLTTAPELPATTLTTQCYQSMFQGCTSLTTAPALSATTLATQCYQSMFYGCTSLTTAPVLSATTLADNCYQQMFYGCTSLNSITCLATDISATSCTNHWLSGVAASGTFIKAASMSSWTTGADGIPSGWTVQDYSG